MIFVDKESILAIDYNSSYHIVLSTESIITIYIIILFAHLRQEDYTPRAAIANITNNL